MGTRTVIGIGIGIFDQPYLMEDEKYEGAAQMFKSAEKLVGTSKIA
jgi:hypothetical protein